MTYKEIIKGLEEELHHADYHDLDYADAVSVSLLKNAYTLINRQQAEIEELNEFANERLDKFTERYDRNLKAKAIKEFADRILGYIDAGHLRPPTELCFSDLDVRQIV